MDVETAKRILEERRLDKDLQRSLFRSSAAPIPIQRNEKQAVRRACDVDHYLLASGP